MLGITGLMSGADRPAERASALLSALPPGSYLPAERRHGHQRGTEPGGRGLPPAVGPDPPPAPPEEIASWLAGPDPVEPGVVATASGRPDPGDDATEAPDVSVAGAARKT
ncbi:hypothetical protein ACPCAJ_11930 [Streptomyces griseoincarnatus]